MRRCFVNFETIAESLPLHHFERIAESLPLHHSWHALQLRCSMLPVMRPAGWSRTL